jgi:hypothetical protein
MLFLHMPPTLTQLGQTLGHSAGIQGRFRIRSVRICQQSCNSSPINLGAACVMVISMVRFQNKLSLEAPADIAASALVRVFADTTDITVCGGGTHAEVARAHALAMSAPVEPSRDP